MSPATLAGRLENMRDYRDRLNWLEAVLAERSGGHGRSCRCNVCEARQHVADAAEALDREICGVGQRGSD